MRSPLPVDNGYGKIRGGPTLGFAVTAWIFGVVGSILILKLGSKATANLDGPFKNFLVLPQQQAPGYPPAIPQPSAHPRARPPPAYTEDIV